MGVIKKFLLKRLKEPSTWRGIIGFITLFGITLSPDQVELISTAGATLYCLVLTFCPDKPCEPAPKPQTQPITNGSSPATEPTMETSVEVKPWNGEPPAGSFHP